MSTRPRGPETDWEVWGLGPPSPCPPGGPHFRRPHGIERWVGTEYHGRAEITPVGCIRKIWSSDGRVDRSGSEHPLPTGTTESRYEKGRLKLTSTSGPDPPDDPIVCPQHPSPLCRLVHPPTRVGEWVHQHLGPRDQENRWDLYLEEGTSTPLIPSHLP